VSEFASFADLDKAFRVVSENMARTAKAMAEIGEVARRLNRDLIRAGRRHSLIHNGRKPR